MGKPWHRARPNPRGTGVRRRAFKKEESHPWVGVYDTGAEAIAAKQPTWNPGDAAPAGACCRSGLASAGWGVYDDDGLKKITSLIDFP